MRVENSTPARLLVINIKTGRTEVEHGIPDAGKWAHPQFRRARMTAAGTYVLPFLGAQMIGGCRADNPSRRGDRQFGATGVCFPRVGRGAGELM